MIPSLNKRKLKHKQEQKRQKNAGKKCALVWIRTHGMRRSTSIRLQKQESYHGATSALIRLRAKLNRQNMYLLVIIYIWKE